MAEPTMHDPESKKSMDARLARIEGQVRAVRRMISDDEACEAIAQQLSAARRALDRAFYEMVACSIERELGDTLTEKTQAAVEDVSRILAKYG